MIFRCLALLAFAWVSFLPILPSRAQILSASVLALLFSLFLILGTANSQRVIVLKALAIVCLALWALLWGQLQLEQRLSSNLESVDIRIEGVVKTASYSAAGDQRLGVSVSNAFEAYGQMLGEFPNLIGVRRSHSRKGTYSDTTR